MNKVRKFNKIYKVSSSSSPFSFLLGSSYKNKMTQKYEQYIFKVNSNLQLIEMNTRHQQAELSGCLVIEKALLENQ